MPIPGTKRVAYLEENAGRRATLELTPDDLAQLDALPDATGERYPGGRARLGLTAARRLRRDEPHPQPSDGVEPLFLQKRVSTRACTHSHPRREGHTWDSSSASS